MLAAAIVTRHAVAMLAPLLALVAGLGCSGTNPRVMVDGGNGTVADGNGMDTGVGADASVPADASSPSDANIQLDASSPSDASSPADASIPPDAGMIIGPPYPVLDSYAIKGITPDSGDPATIAGHRTLRVKLDLPWYVWEPSRRSAPCSGGYQEYGGLCYRIDPATDSAIRNWTSRGVVVSAAIWGVPPWARVAGCSPYTADPWFQNFCAPQNADDYARFTGMLARRYNGGANGRIADFIIHNEVNHNIWFDVGCGQNSTGGGITPCNKSSWLQIYAANFNAAYDRIKSHQSQARVLIPFDQNFDTSLTNLNTSWPLIGAEEFIDGFAPLAGARQWTVAFHPYPKGWSLPYFDPKDLPLVTFGNVGVIVGYLMAKFPTRPHAWEVQLTEQGINSGAGSSETLQDTGLCNAHRNVLGTPNITSFILYRYKDFGALENGAAMGLVREDNTFKPSWFRWAAMNKPGSYDCGFEELPYTILKRGNKAGAGHWASSRLLPSGFSQEGAGWKLYRERQPGTVMVFECARGSHNLLTLDQTCAADQPMGPVGWIYTSQVAGTVPLHACIFGGGIDHMVSTDPACEAYETLGLLGYALPND